MSAIINLSSVYREQVKLLVRVSGWRTLRNNFLKENCLCSACGSKSGLQVHHVVPVSINSNLELVWDNLITLCVDCHFSLGHLWNWKCYNPYIVRTCETLHNLKIESRDRLESAL